MKRLVSLLLAAVFACNPGVGLAGSGPDTAIDGETFTYPMTFSR